MLQLIMEQFHLAALSHTITMDYILFLYISVESQSSSEERSYMYCVTNVMCHMTNVI